jgi:hypothetical protein
MMQKISPHDSTYRSSVSIPVFFADGRSIRVKLEIHFGRGNLQARHHFPFALPAIQLSDHR